jgi:dihydrolipoamide dehydrogenase
MTRVVVLGAYGSAGVAAAERLADADEVDELVLVDDGDPGGGLCILRGCMPSKELLSAADHRFRMRHDDRLVGDPPTIDLEATVARKDDHTLGWAGHRREAVHDLAERDGVRFVHDRGTFVDDHTVEVAGERIKADYVVLATGSSLNVPDLPGIDDVDWRSSRDVLDATALPESGVVMGFGYIGLELVPYLAENGVDLTVIEHDDRPLDDVDPMFGRALLEMYREDFDVDVRTEVYEESVERTDDGVRLHLDDGSVAEGEELFLFTGRKPTLDVGIEHTRLETGPEWVRDTMQATDDHHVYVVGDVTGTRMVLHNAKEEGYVAGENIVADLRGDDLSTYHPIDHQVMFSGAGTYPYAKVGMSEHEARKAGRDVVVTARQAADDGVFKTKNAARGGAKLVVDANDGCVLGYQGLHLHADVMAKTMQIVVELKLDVRDLPERAYHPTTPEILDGLVRDAVAALE